MSDDFRPLAEFLRRPVIPAAADATPSAVPEAIAPLPEPLDVPSLQRGHVEFCESIDVARLACIEAFQRAARRLLETFAKSVFARELSLTAVDIDALCRTALQSLDAEGPVALIVASQDLASVSCGVPVRGDETLSPGDLVVEVRDGVVDARLAVRLRLAINEATA